MTLNDTDKARLDELAAKVDRTPEEQAEFDRLQGEDAA